MKKIVSSSLPILLVFAVVLSITQILLTNQLAAAGKIAQVADISIDELRQENEILEQRIASASALTTIAAKARDMGFMEPTKAQLMTLVPQELPVAFVKPQ